MIEMTRIPVCAESTPNFLILPNFSWFGSLRIYLMKDVIAMKIILVYAESTPNFFIVPNFSWFGS